MAPKKTRTIGGHRFERARQKPYTKAEAKKRAKSLGATRHVRIIAQAGGWMVWTGRKKTVAPHATAKSKRDGFVSRHPYRSLSDLTPAVKRDAFIIWDDGSHFSPQEQDAAEGRLRKKGYNVSRLYALVSRGGPHRKKRNPSTSTPARKRKPQLKKGDQVAFQGRRWFDRRYGNTYHTVTVSILPKGAKKWKDIGSSTIEYGYDRQYEQTGEKLLRKKYSMPRGWGKRRTPLWKLRDFGVTFESTATDVKRKRDL